MCWPIKKKLSFFVQKKIHVSLRNTHRITFCMFGHRARNNAWCCKLYSKEFDLLRFSSCPVDCLGTKAVHYSFVPNASLRSAPFVVWPIPCNNESQIAQCILKQLVLSVKGRLQFKSSILTVCMAFQKTVDSSVFHLVVQEEELACWYSWVVFNGITLTIGKLTSTRWAKNVHDCVG